MKQVVLGLHLAEKDAMAAIRKTRASAIATEEKPPATPENPTTIFRQLRNRKSKAKPNMKRPFSMQSLLDCDKGYLLRLAIKLRVKC